MALAAEDCIINSVVSSDSSDGNTIPHVKSRHGFTVYYEVSGMTYGHSACIENSNDTNAMYDYF